MNGILIVDKPAGWTSHDVVAKLRGLLGEKRIGHGGTLDPMATGVLPVFVGRATRAVEFMENAGKEYEALLRPGLETDTQDTTGRVLRETPVKLTAAELEAVLPAFCGEIEQLPPMYSAIKVQGKKLYEYARKGQEAERKPRRVTIERLELLGEREGDFLLRVACSKGTYIRTLCADIGASLGCGAAMSGLRRTRAGVYTLAEAHPLEELLSLGREGAAALLLSTESIFAAYPRITADAEDERRCRNGLAPRAAGPEGPFRLVSQSGEFLALCQGGAENRLIKSFFEPVGNTERGTTKA
jgi:tRNA pseudouridine55 synthase